MRINPENDAPEGPQYTHDEESIQAPAISWLISNRGYREIVSDIGAKGDRVDSIGVMDGRLHLVEVKPTVQIGMVVFDPAESGSIESKISNALSSLHGRSDEPKWHSVRNEWDTRTAPIVVVLAGKFGNGAIAALTRMLDARKIEWCFDYALWRWNGTGIDEICRDISPATGNRDYAVLNIPLQIGHANRNSPRPHDELQMLADRLGIGPLFTFALAEARRRGLREKRGRQSIAFHRGSARGSWVASIPLTKRACPEPSCGLNLSFYHPAFPPGPNGYPGQSAPKANYGMNNQFLATEADITAMFNLLFDIPK